MQTIALTTSPSAQIISAYATSNEQIPAVEASPGWFVLGETRIPVTVRGRLEVVGSVSGDGLVLRGRLFDVTAGQPVGGSVAVVESTVSTRSMSGIVEMLGGHVYQIQAEVVGSASGFGNASANLIG